MMKWKETYRMMKECGLMLIDSYIPQLPTHRKDMEKYIKALPYNGKIL